MSKIGKQPLLLFPIIFLLSLSLLLWKVVAQDSEANIAPITPTPIVFPPSVSPYPELICPYFPSVQPGYTWQGLTIGVSTHDNLETVLSGYGRYELRFPADGSLATSISYVWDESVRRGRSQRAPFSVDVCLQDGKIVVLDIAWFNQYPMYLSDLVAILSIPNVVSWSNNYDTRDVFWFDYGIMAEIFILRGDSASFGRLVRMIMFPPQSSEGYETKWPYKFTPQQSSIIPANADAPTEENPFNFETMIAAITAEPSRTPTPIVIRPTITPRSGYFSN